MMSALHRPYHRSYKAVRLLTLVFSLTAAQFSLGQNVIRFATGDAPYRAGYEELAKEYEQLHPGVDVQVQVIPTDGYATWIRTAVAGGADTCPDIFNINNASGYFESGKAISLRPYLDSLSPYSGKKWSEGFERQYLEMVRTLDDYPSVPLNFIEVGFYYNKDIYKKAGLAGPPKTWEEFLVQCEKIRAAGYVPVAMPADFENTWAGTFGWLVRIFTDAFFFEFLPAVSARPGDYAFDPGTDANWKLDPDDRFCDLLVNVPMERYLQAVLDGDLPYDGPHMKEVYKRIKDFSIHWQQGFAGTDLNTCYYRYFLAGRAAVFLHTSAGALQWDNEMARMDSEARFEWGVFGFPPLTSSELCKIPFRGTGSPIPLYGIIKTTRKQQDLAADFLMFITTPKSARTLLDQTLAQNLSIVGPFAIKDVPMPEGLAERFEPFLGRGREKMQLRGLYDEQQSTWRWALAVQDYLGEQLTLEEFTQNYQKSIVETIPRLIKSYGLDMDPQTRDNNGQLLAEIPVAVAEAGTKTSGPARDARVFAQSIADVLKSTSGRRSDFLLPDETTSPFTMVVERTVPFLFARSRDEFQRLAGADAAKQLCQQHGYQYLAIVLLNGKEPDLKIHSFRPTVEEVIRRQAGKRYTNAELQKLWRL